MKNLSDKIIFVLSVIFLVFFIRYDYVFIGGFSIIFKKFSEFSFVVKKEIDHMKNSIDQYFSSIDKNKILKKENEALKRELIFYRNNAIFERDIKEIFHKLKEVYSKTDIKDRLLFGILIKSYDNKYILISDDKIEVGDLVFSNKSLVGRVKSVKKNYYIVVSTHHKDFKVKAMGLISKKEGILSINSNGCCVFFPKNLEASFIHGEEIVVLVDNNMYVPVGNIKSKIQNGLYFVDLISNYSSIGMVIKGNSVE